MDTSTLDRCLARLEALERANTRIVRENRRMKIAAVGLLALVSIGALAGAQQNRGAQQKRGAQPNRNQVVEAQAFVLRDKDGNLRATLDSSERQGVFFYLFDERGQTIRFGISSGKNGQVLARITDIKGEDRLTFGVHAEGMPHLALYAKDQKPVVRMGVSAEDEAGISLFGKNDHARVQIISPDTEPPLIEMFDEKGKFLFQAPSAIGKK
jgi:hypothetical protein